MQIKLLSLLSVIVLSLTAARAQTEAPIDTLTNRVNIISSDVDVMKRIKITGYMQPQYQVADSSGVASFAGGDFTSGLNKRFALRRGRVKFTYDYSNTQFVIQIDGGEKGVSFTDVYGKYTEPWLNAFSIQAGIFNRPWGYEIPISSSVRESPERARWSQTLMPGERDLGVMAGFQMPKTSMWNFLSLQVAMVNGTGRSASDFDYQKDLIAHLGLSKNICHEKIKLGVGGSYYSGGIRQFTKFVYSNGTNSSGVKTYVVDSASTNKDAIAGRTYIGADLQFVYESPIGTTTLRGEFIQGQQPAFGNSSTTSPTASSTSDTYIRNCQGLVAYFVQNIKIIKSGIVVKYDMYDPNTDVAGGDIGVTGSKLTKADIAYTTLGFGYLFYINANTKLCLYRDMVSNESTKLKGWTQDLKDDVWTFRLQFKF